MYELVSHFVGRVSKYLTSCPRSPFTQTFLLLEINEKGVVLWNKYNIVTVYRGKMKQTEQ